jgi:solute carrier family 12 sodium/potassium/chloride transporter 2
MIVHNCFAGQTINLNLWPDFRLGQTFITVFGVYFPAMTGIMAGANMSGDLRDPSSAIPKGTVMSIIITTIIYSTAMLLTAFTTVRDADGIESPIVNGEYMAPMCAVNNTCHYGLANDYEVCN